MSQFSHHEAKGVMPVVYVPHGGGPLPLLGEQNHTELIHFLRNLPSAIARPRAIVMISAHWETPFVRISSAMQPEMIYDYGGFPAECYEYKYRAPGNPALAKNILEMLKANDFECSLDADRGFDHGTFVPLMLMYPEAQIPVVQVSLLQSFDPAQHIELGKALAPLREQGVLIIGSGMSFHSSKASVDDGEIFDEWLCQVLVNGQSHEVTEKLIGWAQAPSARACHRREEHLLPLHVCWGAASDENKMAIKIFSGNLFNRRISGFMWQ